MITFGQSLWQPPLTGTFKFNSDVATKNYFAVTTTVLPNSQG